MSTQDSFESLVYPIRALQTWKFDNVENIEWQIYGKSVKIGKKEWCIKLRKDSEDSALAVYLVYRSEPKKGVYIVNYVVRLLSPSGTGRLVNWKGPASLYGTSFDIGQKNFLHELNIGNIDEKGTVLLELALYINDHLPASNTINFELEKPSYGDLKTMMKPSEPGEETKFQQEIIVTELATKGQMNYDFLVDGLKALLTVVKRDTENGCWLQAFVKINWDDDSDWWSCEAAGCFRILNFKNQKSPLSRFRLCAVLEKKNNLLMGINLMKWEDFVNSDHIENGKFIFQTFVQVVGKVGFDNFPNRGICTPIRKITDLVLLVGEKKLYVSKKILAQQSAHFANIIFANPKLNELRVDTSDLYFINFLELIYNIRSDITEDNVEDVLELIDEFEAPECYDRCDLIMQKQEFKDAVKLLKLINKYPLYEMKKNFSRMLVNETTFKLVLESEEYKSMSAEMKVSVLESRRLVKEAGAEEERTEFQSTTDFKTISECSDLKLEVQDTTFFVCKQILGNASHRFLARLYGPYASEEEIIEIVNMTPEAIHLMLTHIYHPVRPVTSSNFNLLLELAQKYLIPRLMEKCEEYLVLSEEIPLIDKFECAGQYDLHHLMASCFKKLSNENVKRDIEKHWKFVHLPAKVAELWNKMKVLNPQVMMQHDDTGYCKHPQIYNRYNYRGF